MIWTSVFPVLDDEDVRGYATRATAAEKHEIGGLLEEKQVVPGRRSSGIDPRNHWAGGHPKQIVSASLFWRDLRDDAPEVADDATPKNFDQGASSGWAAYFARLGDLSAGLFDAHPEVSFRLYVGAGMEARAEALASIGWDVHVMKHASPRYCPAALWRFLALGESNSHVTVVDLERMDEAMTDIGRTRALPVTGLGAWRVPAYYNAEADRFMLYRPMIGGQFGAKSVEDIKLLLESFLWHSRRGSLRATAMVPGADEKVFPFSLWLGFGFDEWFLLTTLFPRLAAEGLLTFVPSDSRSTWLPFDLEYVMWCNPDSESILF